MGDVVRLTQALVNLLNNAAKYTPVGGKIQLRASLRGAEIELRVADNGKGIAPDMRARSRRELVAGFGERDVQAALAVAYALEQELQCEGGLAGSRVAVYQIDAICKEAPLSDLIETGDSCSQSLHFFPLGLALPAGLIPRSL